MMRDQLWTSAALAVDGFPVQLHRFGKSHQLIRADPGRPKGLHSQRRFVLPRILPLRAYHLVSFSF
jgi:hypothetical protein